MPVTNALVGIYRMHVLGNEVDRVEQFSQVSVKPALNAFAITFADRMPAAEDR